MAPFLQAQESEDRLRSPDTPNRYSIIERQESPSLR